MSKTYAGNPCKRGHPGERYVSGGACVQCALERASTYRVENPEKVAAAKRQCIAARPEQYAATQKRWNAANPDKVSASKDAWLDRNPERRRQVSRAYYARNPETHAERVKRWESSNPGARVEIARRRREREREAGGHITEADIEELFRLQAGLCAYFGFCESDLTISGYHADHIVPVEQGGPGWAWNRQLTCPTCNKRKGIKSHDDFVAVLQHEREAA